MSLLRKVILAAVVATGAVLALSACLPAAPIDVTAETVVIDVRTPEEFASGHLDGARNIDWQGNFKTEILAMPTDGHYVLYCRSGSRAGEALTFMKSAGFAHVVNAGSVAEAAEATGIAVVAD